MSKTKDYWADQLDADFAKWEKTGFPSPENDLEPPDEVYDRTANNPIAQMQSEFTKVRQIVAEVGAAHAIEMKQAEFKRLMAQLESIEVAPGFGLHRFLSSVCTKSFTENVLDQLLADGTELYQERLAAGDKWGARRVRWAMRTWMLRAVIGSAVSAVLSVLWGQHKSSK